jgi:hypothetical protein
MRENIRSPDMHKTITSRRPNEHPAHKFINVDDIKYALKKSIKDKDRLNETLQSWFGKQNSRKEPETMKIESSLEKKSI